MEDKENWLSIVEYSQQTGISISTIRRRIKSNKIDFQEIGGKYFIKHNGGEKQIVDKAAEKDAECIMLRLEVDRLKKVIAHQREEMEDLRMLVQLYEGQQKTDRPSIVTTELPPELPLM